ncbi:MAG: hypothetical protein AB7T10_00745 [bacterium]
MTFKRVLFLLTLSVLCISLSAQFVSFRSLSTAGLIDDNIEAILAVTEMTYVDGFNVFTNLSNFNYLSEDIFDGYSDNYLVGFKGSMMDMLHLGFLSVSNGYSEGYADTTIATEYIDNNNDEQYDELVSETNNYSDLEADNWSTNYLAFTFGKPEGLKAGFSYTNNRGAYTYDEIYNDEIMDSNIISGDLMRLYNEWYDYTYENLYTDNYYTLNGAFSAGAMEFALSIGLDFFKEVYFGYDVESIYENLSPSDPSIVNFWSEDFNDSSDYITNGFGWNIGLKGYYRTTNQDSVEFGGYFSNTNYGRTNVTEYYIYNYNEVLPGVVDEERYSFSYRDSYGDSVSMYSETYLSWGMGGKFVKKLEKAHFAMGAFFGQSKDSYIDTVIYDYRYDESYDDGNGVDDAGDYVYLETGSYSGEYVYNSLSTYLQMPVGIEYNFWGPLTGRLGANTQLSWRNSYNSSKYFAFDPGTYTVTYGDGSVYEYLNDWDTYREDYSYGYSSFYRETYFEYGIGWEISKNVKIDLMGFSDLTDLTDWSISANVKF